MTIRVLKNFNGYKPGQVFDWPDGMARIFIARGMAEEIREEVVEEASVEAKVERAVVATRRKAK